METNSSRNQCGARLDVGASDTYRTIMKCQLESGHRGKHKEAFRVKYWHEKEASIAVVIWR